MVKVSVMYPNRPDATFNREYYLTKHMPLVSRLLEGVMRGGAVDQGIDTPEGPAPYLFIAHLWFDSLEAFNAAMTQHGAALMGDIPNYTNVQPVVQVSSVVIAGEPAAAQAAN
jgi:uncharacterized protein (TIGR02118 family)